jgi:MFS family permease
MKEGADTLPRNVSATNRYRVRISSIFLLHGITFSTWIGRIPSAQANLRLSPGTLGLILLCAAIGSIVFMPIAGLLVARCGSRAVVRVSSVCFCLALLLPAFSGNALQLACSLFVFGAAAGSMNVSMNDQAVLVESAARKPMMSSFHALFSMGGMIGAFLGGVSADHGVSIQRQLLMSSIVLAVGVWLATSDLLEGESHQSNKAPGLAVRLTFSIFALGLLAFCAGIGEGSMADWSGIYLYKELQTSLGKAAFGYAVFSGAMLVGRLAGDWITSMLGTQLCVSLGYLFGVLGLSLSLITHSLTLTLIGFLVVGLGLSVVIPNIFRVAGTLEGLPAGYGLAAATTLGYLGFLSGPPVIGGLAQLYSLRVALVFVVVALVLGTILAMKGFLPATRPYSVRDAVPIK